MWDEPDKKMGESFIDSVEKAYGTRDLYEVLGVAKEAKDTEIKRAYHKLSLKVHPDRVELNQIEESTLKFQILSKIYSVLSDPEKRTLYNDTGCVDEDDVIDQDTDWVNVWKMMFKSITIEDIKQFEKKYKGSIEEEDDLKSAYIDYEGNMDKIMESVMCSEMGDEDRYKDLISGWIAEGSVPSFPSFVNETNKKKMRRKRKFEKEANEAEELSKELGINDGMDSLKMLIEKRQKDRQDKAEKFFDQLAEKYAPKAKKSKMQKTKSEKEEQCTSSGCMSNGSSAKRKRNKK
jgi:DnaJ family protein C protein 9